ncbi:MAG: adenylate/guanylate cyclase domain-containing protein [Microcoleus sp.]
MRLPKLYTLRKKLIVSFLIVALIPLMLLAAIDKHATEQILTKNAEQSLFAIASQTAVSIDTFITVNLNDVRVAALLPGLSKYLSLPPESRAESEEKKVVEETLHSLSRRDTVNIFSYALLDIKGKNVLDTYSEDIGKDESNRDYFQQPLNTGLPYVSNLRLSAKKPGLVNIYFSNLVRNSQGVAVGLLRVSYNATVLDQSIARQTGLAGQKSFAILLDENYIRLAHGTEPELIFKSVVPLPPDLVKKLQAERRLPELPLDELSTNLPQLKQGLDSAVDRPFLRLRLTSTDNQLSAVAIAPLHNLPWYVLFVQPQSVFLAPIEAQTRTALILSLIIASIVTLVGIILARILAKPIIVLTQRIAQFKAGNLNIRVPIESRDELGNLADTFNKMIERIQSYTDSLEVKNAALLQVESQLRESESRLSQLLEAMPVGVFVTDANGQPYYANQVAQQLLGQGVLAGDTIEELVQNYQIYIAGTKQNYNLEIFTIPKLLRGEYANADNIEIHRADKVIPIEAWGTPIFDNQGNISYTIIAFQDISERRKIEAEREKFTEELSQLNRNLKKALDAELELTDAYGRFVPHQFLHLLGYESIVDVKLGDNVQQKMSVLFADIRDFTALSESMTPQDNFKFINDYLIRMEPCITASNGFIDKYIGDGIMALFSGSADDAVKAGIAMLQSLAEYNLIRKEGGYAPIKIGIGINTGSLMLGTVGGENRMDGTVISDAVNLASRLEGLTKNYGISLLISHHTFSALTIPSDYDIRLIDRVQVKGKSELVTVYEVFNADLPEVREAKAIAKTAFESAWILYNQERFTEAAQLFEDCVLRNPADGVAAIYLDRCQQQF